MKKIVLISCVKSKRDVKSAARDLYVSPLFKMNLEYARSMNPNAIYILSAKFGLVELDRVIEPYELTLNNMPSQAIKIWAEGVLKQLGKLADLDHDHFVFLAGQKYRIFITPKLRFFDVPMKGLGLGRQLQFLKRMLHERSL